MKTPIPPYGGSSDAEIISSQEGRKRKATSPLKASPPNNERSDQGKGKRKVDEGKSPRKGTRTKKASGMAKKKNNGAGPSGGQ
ncbi:hypothetical protein PIB30_114852, partial [Stylosanthes scabra]|nr:hypothetical protein [Stylosanthes scabra]